MRELWLISAFLLCNLLFAENNDLELIRYNSIDISLMDTSELDPKLKHFLYKYYQKNYSGNEYIKTVKSMQFFGSYSVNGEEIGTIKLIKKRPNKYKSHIKRKMVRKKSLFMMVKAFKKVKQPAQISQLNGRL